MVALTTVPSPGELGSRAVSWPLASRKLTVPPTVGPPGVGDLVNARSPLAMSKTPDAPWYSIYAKVSVRAAPGTPRTDSRPAPE